MKRKMQKGLSLLLVFVFLTGIVPISKDGFTIHSVASDIGTIINGYYGDNLTWSLDSTGVLVIEGSGEMNNTSSFTWRSYEDEIKSVIIGDGITSIGDHAFYGLFNVRSIIIGKNVTNIGNGAFSFCGSLEELIIPNSVITIGDYAFWTTGIQRLTIGESVKHIGSCAFDGCCIDSSILLPDGLEHIGNQAFQGTNARTIFLPKSLKYIGNYFFSGGFEHGSNVIYQGSEEEWEKINKEDENGISPDFYNAVLEDNLILNTDRTILYSCFDYDKDGSVTIPDTVEHIYDFAFVHSGLSSLALPESLISIGVGAFVKCKNLKEVFIPNSVESIGDYTFHDCESLEKIQVHKSNEHYSSDAFGVLFDKDKKTLKTYPIGNKRTHYSIPRSVTTIGYRAFENCTNLISVKIPYGVEYIDTAAFQDCTGLKKISVPNSVISLEIWAFCGCNSLTSIELSEGLEYIGQGAFEYCSGLTDIRIPDSVWGMDYGVFYDCSNLRTIKLPPELSFIKGNMFCGCNNLSSITLPVSVSSIQFEAFYDCSSLTDVYYLGSENEWDAIEIDEQGNDVLKSATIHFITGEIRIQSSNQDSKNQSYDGNYTMSNLNMTCEYTYSDQFFKGSAYEYNPSLATLSLCFAISAMVEDGGPYESKKPHAAGEMLKKTGFKNNTCYGYNVEPATKDNVIACVIGNKDLDENTTLIAIAVRGGGYEGEWGYNFQVGESTDHVGFKNAKEIVINNLGDFVKSHRSEFKENVKFWITGYSRSAAVANLVAAALDERVSNIYINKLNYSPKEVFAYTFETPQNTTNQNARNELYKNIFNIINPIDPVPRVAPSSWGYKRFGIDCLLPSVETRGDYYPCFKRVMSEVYKRITGGKEYQESFVYAEPKVQKTGFLQWDGVWEENPDYSQAVYLDHMIGLLADSIFLNRKNFVAKYQPAIVKLLKNISHLPPFSEYVDAIKEEFSLLSVIRIGLFDSNDEIRKILAKAFNEYLSTTNANISYEEAYDLFEAVDYTGGTALRNFGSFAALIYNDNYSRLFIPHYSEVTLAWMLSFPLSVDFDTTYRVARFNCPVDISVYNSRDELVASIVDDEIQNEQTTISVYIDNDGQKCFCLPNDEEYRFEIIGTDDGVMSCSFSDYDFVESQWKNAINYYNIPVMNGSMMSAVLEEKYDNNTSTVSIIENGTEIQASEILEQDMFDTYTYTVSVEKETQDGVVIGGGEYIKGEFAELLAIPGENSSFEGWFVDGIMLSDEQEYRFMVDHSVNILGKFAKKDEMILLGDVDNDGNIFAADARLALRRAVDLETYAPGSREFIACDVDKDNAVTSADARKILRAAVDLEDPSTW